VSGQLVGEVIAAAAELKSRGLSERGFYALIAIAEKCHTDSRQGSVPWAHIQSGLYGSSKRTSQRAVHDAQCAGLLRVVKTGFNNNHGRVCAPIYEIPPLGERINQATQSPPTDDDTQASQSPPTDDDTQVSQSHGDRSRQNEDRSRQNEDRSRHLGVVLNGSINGSTNGRESGAAPIEPLDVEAVPEPGNALSPINLPEIKNDGPVYEGEYVTDATPDPEPPRYCPDHMPSGTGRKCGGCKHMREQHEAWTRRQLARVIASAPAPPPPPPPPRHACTYCQDTRIVLDSAGVPLRHRGELRICECDGIGRRAPQPGEIAALDTAGNLDELKAAGNLPELLALSSTEGPTE